MNGNWSRTVGNVGNIEELVAGWEVERVNHVAVRRWRFRGLSLFEPARWKQFGCCRQVVIPSARFDRNFSIGVLVFKWSDFDTRRSKISLERWLSVCGKFW